MKHVENIAHRGARAFAPENTLEAIRKAADLGADAVEIDVQLSADGEPVVFHDDTLERCTDAATVFSSRAPWSTAGFTLAELRQLDAGSWFADELGHEPAARQTFLHSLTDEERRTFVDDADLRRFASGTVRIPTLDEALDTCRTLGLGVHLELKNIPRFWPDLTAKAVAALVQHGMQQTVVLSSFDHPQLALARRIDPSLRTAVLSSDRLYDPVGYLARLGAEAYNPGCYGPYDTLGFGAVTGRLDLDTVVALTSAGYAVNAWTENDPDRMRVLIDSGVSGIFTDYPNRLKDLLSAR